MYSICDAVKHSIEKPMSFHFNLLPKKIHAKRTHKMKCSRHEKPSIKLKLFRKNDWIFFSLFHHLLALWHAGWPGAMFALLKVSKGVWGFYIHEFLINREKANVCILFHPNRPNDLWLCIFHNNGLDYGMRRLFLCVLIDFQLQSSFRSVRRWYFFFLICTESCHMKPWYETTSLINW